MIVHRSPFHTSVSPFRKSLVSAMPYDRSAPKTAKKANIPSRRLRSQSAHRRRNRASSAEWPITNNSNARRTSSGRVRVDNGAGLGARACTIGIETAPATVGRGSVNYVVYYNAPASRRAEPGCATWSGPLPCGRTSPQGAPCHRRHETLYPIPSLERFRSMSEIDGDTDEQPPGAWLYASATALVAGVALVLWHALGSPVDTPRPPARPDHAQLRVELSHPGPSIAWEPVEQAFRYRVVVWDPQRAAVAGSYRTPDNELGPEHEIVLALRADLETGRGYTLRVDAIDTRNRRIQSSATVDFTAE